MLPVLRVDCKIREMTRVSKPRKGNRRVLGRTIIKKLLDDVTERLLGLLVQVGDGNARSKDGVVRVRGRLVRGRLGGEVVELDRRDTFVDAIDNLLGKTRCGIEKGGTRRRRQSQGDGAKGRREERGKISIIPQTLSRREVRVCTARIQADESKTCQNEHSPYA